mgnify:CR=1 FL=1
MSYLPGSLPPSPGGRLARLCARYIGFAGRHAGLLLLLAAVVLGLALMLVLKLELRTDLAELLPESHPSVVALRRVSGRQKSATNLVLMIDSPDKEANKRFIAALKPALERMIPDVFSEIQWKPDTEIPEHAARWKWLYAEPQDLQHSEELLDRIIARRKAPLLVDFEGDAEQELTKLRQDLDKKLPPVENSPYFSRDKDGHNSLGVMLWRRRDGLGSLGDHYTLKSVREIVERTGPKSFHPQMTVEYTGHIAMAVDEQKTIQESITAATLVCASLVLLVIYLYFRRLGMLVVIGVPAFIGVLLSLMLAQLALKYLNINTAFLISIILGNGINTPIILLARYGEERRRGEPAATALSTALTHTMLATGTAMLAAGIAYGSLMVTDFRGFNQFGLIGGAGMVLVWICTMLLVPPIILVGERLRPGVFTPKANLWSRPFAVLGGMVQRRPVVFAALSAVALAVALVPLGRYIKDPLEWDLNNLRSDETAAQRLWGKMEEMGMGNVGAGYIGNTGVLLVDTPEQAEPVAEAMRQKDAARGPAHVLAAVRTIMSVLPPKQDEKLAILGRIRQKIDRYRELMSEDEWRDIAGFRPPEYLRRLTPDDLPRIVREAFTETDDTRGRLIGMDADYAVYQDWNGHDLLRLAEALRVEALGKTWVAASAGTVFGGMIETIHRDGPQVTLVALVGVLGLVVIMFGLRGAVPVILALALGIMWLGGMLGYLHLKLNFMNFVTIPITLGVGADYAANIWARLRDEGPGQIREVIASTGSAVVLCSTTTMIGYSTLLLANNRALRSFGLAADIGEITCLLAALLFMPVLVGAFWRHRAGSASR